MSDVRLLLSQFGKYIQKSAVKTVNSWSLASAIPILDGADLGSLPTNSLVHYLFEKKKKKKTPLRRGKKKTCPISAGYLSVSP